MKQSFRGVVTEIPPHLVFLIIGGLNAVLLTILTPPFQVHDELQHFFRAYQLSEMQVLGSVSKGPNYRGLVVDRGGGVLPSSLSEFVDHTWGTRNYWDIPPVGSHRLIDTWAEFHRPLAPERPELTKRPEFTHKRTKHEQEVGKQVSETHQTMSFRTFSHSDMVFHT